MPNIFRMLHGQHMEIAALLDQAGRAADSTVDSAGRRRLVDHLVIASSRHEAAEEMAFWPSVRHRLDDGPRLAEEGLRQESDAKYLLDSVRAETSEEGLTEGLRELGDLVRRHIAFEQDRVWPELRRVTGSLGASLMGRRLSMSMRAAPTRPHPRGPEHASGLATVGLVASLGDKVRDGLSGRSVPPPGEELGAPGGHDAIEFLMAEHARIDSLLANVPPDGRASADLVARIVKELSVHDSIEREHLYPVLRRRLAHGNDLFPTWISEHGKVASILAEVDRRPVEDSYRFHLLLELIPAVRAHVAEEEGGVLPAMRARMTAGERADIGRALAEGKDRAPTRPHSHIAGTGVGARMSRVLAAPIDKTRDALSGRR